MAYITEKLLYQLDFDKAKKSKQIKLLFSSFSCCGSSVRTNPAL